MTEVGMYGTTGYTGLELIHLLQGHPHVHLRFAASRSFPGTRLIDLFPSGPDLELSSPDHAALPEVDLAFLCLPHGSSAPIDSPAIQLGIRVIDLSADFRLRDPALYSEWYGLNHPAPNLIQRAIYGLTESARGDLPQADLIANPGCYPTSVLLALRPLVSSLSLTGPVIIDAKSGVSGAGRTPQQSTHFVEVANNLKPYNIGRCHRHLPEIEQVLDSWTVTLPYIVFCPHLVPLPRGLLSTIYIPFKNELPEDDVVRLFQAHYEAEPFVQVLPWGEPATLAHAVHTNWNSLGANTAASSGTSPVC